METIDVRLLDIMSNVKVTLQKMLTIKVEEDLEILVGSIMREDRKLDDSVSINLLTGSNVSCFSRSMLKSPRTKIFFEFSLLIFSNNDGIISCVNLFICRDRCLETRAQPEFERSSGPNQKAGQNLYLTTY